jgi:hypothetical protein
MTDTQKYHSYCKYGDACDISEARHRFLEPHPNNNMRHLTCIACSNTTLHIWNNCSLGDPKKCGICRIAYECGSWQCKTCGVIRKSADTIHFEYQCPECLYIGFLDEDKYCPSCNFNVETFIENNNIET